MIILSGMFMKSSYVTQYIFEYDIRQHKIFAEMGLLSIHVQEVLTAAYCLITHMRVFYILLKTNVTVICIVSHNIFSLKITLVTCFTHIPFRAPHRLSLHGWKYDDSY